MSFHSNMHKLAGVALTAATLLALAPMGVANAADASIAVPSAAAETITVKLGDKSVTPGIEADANNMKNHSFKALRVGTYGHAVGDAETKTLSSVSVATDSAVLADAETALKSVTGVNAAEGYEGNPIGEVASKWLGYSSSAAAATNGDTTSNNGDADNAWGSKGNLRKFVSALAKQPGFKASITGSAHTASANAEGTEAKFTNLEPGMYVVEDVTAASAGAPNAKNSIPMFVGTAITAGGVTYNKIDGQTLGEIVMKNDDQPSVAKTIDGSEDNDPSIGGTMHYVLTGKVPLTTGYDHYIFTMIDRPLQDGLTYVDDSVNITVNGVKLESSDYTVNAVKSADGVSTAYVVFDLSPSIRAQKYQDSIKVTYAMKVNDNAAGGALRNGASLGFSNDTNNQPSKDSADVAVDPTSDKPVVTNGGENGSVASTSDSDSGSNVAAYFRSFDILKKSKANDKAIAGAKFEVTDESGAAVKFRKLDDGSYKKAADQTSTDASYASTTLAVSSTAGAEGKLKVDGLKGGTYTVNETEAPNGFSATFKPSFTVTLSGAAASGEAAATSMVSNTGDTWGLVSARKDAVTATAANAIVVYNVNSVSQLPLTGGAGVILALLVIVALMVITAALIITRRRLNA